MEQAKFVPTPNTKPPIPKPPNQPPQNISHPPQASSPPTSTTAPPPTSTTAPPPAPTDNNKRKLDNVDVYSNKIRALVKDMRPHFIEVLRTPDFRNSKAAHGIKNQLKLVMNTYRQMVKESVYIEKCKKPSEVQSLPGENKDRHHVEDRQDEEKPAKQHNTDHVSEKLPEIPLVGNTKEKSEDKPLEGSYVIGGSNLGWNFIMYPGSKSVYYGVTKESRLATLASRASK